MLLGCAPHVFLGMFRNKELNISPANQERMVDFINELKKSASPELQADLTGLLARLADGSLQQELGCTVR